MTEYKKCTGISIFNEKGELALQLRATADDSFPGHWDFSAGGGIDEGEDPESAASRELREELGVAAEVEFIGEQKLNYPAWKPGIQRESDLFLYKTLHNGPFILDLKEVDKVEFFPLGKIREMISSGQKFHPEFLLCWNKGIIKP